MPRVVVRRGAFHRKSEIPRIGELSERRSARGRKEKNRIRWRERERERERERGREGGRLNLLQIYYHI